MPGKKLENISLREAFSRVLLHQTGLAVSERLELHQELLDNELELALRLDGLAGDAEGLVGSQDFLDQPAGGAASGAAGSKGKGKGKGKEGKELEASKSAPTWSEDAEELLKLVRRLGPRNPNLCSAAFLKPFFRDLRLPGLNICNPLGEDTWNFSKLTSLDVSRNALVDIDQLPPTLVYLKAYNNCISRVSCRPLPSLCFLGLGHNPLGHDGLSQIRRCFPNLLSLDLSHSEVASLRETSKLQKLGKLRHLCLLSSPVSLLPFYRLTLLRELPLLQALDGVLTQDDEAADAQLRPFEPGPSPAQDAAGTEATEGTEVAEPVGGGPGWLRLRLEFGKLDQHLGLLKEAIMAPGEEEELLAAFKAAAAEEEVEEEEVKDPLSEKCGQDGEIRFSFQLPDGSWISSSSVKLAKKTWEVLEDEPKPPVALKEALQLARLKQASGKHLSFELNLEHGGLRSKAETPTAQQQQNQESYAGLLELRRWLGKGLPVKMFYVPPPVPPAESVEADAGAEGDRGEPGEAGDGAATSVTEAPKVEEVPLGGCVVPLEGFLRRTAPEPLSEAVREAGQLPGYPEPWRQAFSEVHVVPMAHWLDPDVQVPHLDPKAKGCGVANSAVLSDLVVTLYAEPPPTEEPPEEEEKPPERPAKGKAKAKPKK